MQKTNVNTALVMVFVAFAVLVIGGLAATTLITTAMAAQPDFEYCASNKQATACGDTKEQCEFTRETFTTIKGHCHPSQR